MEQLVSIVIPVYNVEHYVERCLKSVMAQTYERIEIIVVDDGSTDSSGEICDKIAKHDTRITVYHKENGGLSDARNYGVEKATGEYITFIDSDDYIATNYIEYLYDLLIQNDAEISCCCMIKTDNDSVQYCVDYSKPKVQVLSGVETCQALFSNLYMPLVTAWGNLYKSEIVRKYPFPKGRKHEDEATTCKYYYESQRVVVGNQCLYAYYQNPTSITHTQADKLNVDAIWALEHRAHFFEEHKESELSQFSWHKFFRYCAMDSLKYGGRCDLYLKDFTSAKALSNRTVLEYRIYKTSKILFRFYLKYSRISAKIKSICKK